MRLLIGRFLAFYGLLLFAITMLLFFPFLLVTSWIKDPVGVGVFEKVAQIWMRFYLLLIGCPVDAKGKSNFKKGETYIVVCNHNSLLDVPLSSPEIPGPNKTIAKIEMAKIPIFGIIYRKGSVLVNRKSDESKRKSYEQMKAVLANGMHMCIYPEGTRNTTNEPLKTFYDGAFKLAVDTQTAIIPAIITGTKKALPAKPSFFLSPRKLRIEFLPPIQPGHSSSELKDKVFQVMWDKYKSLEN